MTPDGTTNPTTGFDTPANSSFFINWGTTSSEELVPSTVKISSLMYFRNFQRLNPDKYEMKPSTTATNRKQVTYIVAISLPSDTIEPRPYLPTVNAIAPNAAIGANRMIMPHDREDAVDERVEYRHNRLGAGADVRQRDTEHDREDQDLQYVVLGQRVDNAGRYHVQQEVNEAGRLGRRRGIGRDGLGVERGSGSTFIPTPGPTRLTTTRPSARANVDNTSK